MTSGLSERFGLRSSIYPGKSLIGALIVESSWSTVVGGVVRAFGRARGRNLSGSSSEEGALNFLSGGRGIVSADGG